MISCGSTVVSALLAGAWGALLRHGAWRAAEVALTAAEAAIDEFNPAKPCSCTAAVAVVTAADSPSLTGDGDCATMGLPDLWTA